MFDQLIAIITKLGSKSNQKIATEFNISLEQLNKILSTFDEEAERLKMKVLISPRSKEIVKFRNLVKDKNDNMSQGNTKLIRVFNTLQTHVKVHSQNKEEVH